MPEQTERSVNKAEQSERLTLKPVRVVASVQRPGGKGPGSSSSTCPRGRGSGSRPAPIPYLQTLTAAL